MSSESTQLEVINPRGALPDVRKIEASIGLKELNGKKIGILNNTKTGGDLLLPYVLESLKKRAPHVEFQEWRVPFQLDPDLKPPRLQEIADYADGVIALTGD